MSKLEIVSTLQWDVPYGTTDADLALLERQIARKGQVVNILWKGDKLDHRVTVFIYKRV